MKTKYPELDYYKVVDEIIKIFDNEYSTFPKGTNLYYVQRTLFLDGNSLVSTVFGKLKKKGLDYPTFEELRNNQVCNIQESVYQDDDGEYRTEILLIPMPDKIMPEYCKKVISESIKSNLPVLKPKESYKQFPFGKPKVGCEIHRANYAEDHIKRVSNIAFSVNIIRAKRPALTWKTSTKDSKENAKRYTCISSCLLEFLAQEPEHYYEWFYDFRGRCYPSAYYINPQGEDWNKSCLEFANKEVISDEIV